MRQKTRAAYFIGEHTAEREQIQAGINWLGWSIVEHRALEAWIVTPSHVSIRGAVQDVLGEATVNALLVRQDLAINGVSFRHHMELTLPYTSPPVTVLVAYPTTRLLTSLGNIFSVVAIAIVAANSEIAEEWITTWQASEVSGG